MEREDLRVEEIISKLGRGVDPALVFLEIFREHMDIAASHIDCPYCAKHMRLDAEEMEAYGFGLACYMLGIPFIKIAVISDNALTGSPWSPESIAVSMRNGVKLLVKMIELGG